MSSPEQVRLRAAPCQGAGHLQGEDPPDPEADQDHMKKALAGAVKPIGETTAGVASGSLSQGRDADLGPRTWTVLHAAISPTRMSQ